MELDYGQGRLILTTLDLEDHFAQDPAAAQLAKQIINYAATSPRISQAQEMVLVGNDGDTVGLDVLGVRYTKADKLIPGAGLHIIGAESGVGDRELQTYLETGGKLLFLPPHPPAQDSGRTKISGSLGIEEQWQENFPGSLEIPPWAETRGVGISDLHARTDFGSWVITSGGEVGAKGLLSRQPQGKGVAIATTLNPAGLFDPDALPQEIPTYLRLTRWRQTRAIAQILANLGATFQSDELIWERSGNNFWKNLGRKFQEKFLGLPPESGFYHPDYWQDFNYGDDPYRYYRW
jgi:beta-galactosidase